MGRSVRSEPRLGLSGRWLGSTVDWIARIPTPRHLDIYLGTRTVDQVLINNGQGQFTIAPGAVTVNVLKWSVALVDVDGDQDLDAVLAVPIANNANGVSRLLRNDGSGRFVEDPNAMPSRSASSQRVPVLDADGDGDPDLVFPVDGYPSPQPNLLYLNDGTGNFTDASTRLPGPPTRSVDLRPIDVDQDGDLDLLEAAFHAPEVPSRLLLNDGRGFFTTLASGLSELSITARRFGIGDFDDDGDPDAFLVSFGPAHVFFNLRRQITWRELPRIGRSLTIDITAQAASPYALAASLGSAQILVPGLGTFRLAASSSLLMATGSCDAQGKAMFQAMVPLDPRLIGTKLYWQALSGNPLRLGNLEVTTFGAR